MLRDTFSRLRARSSVELATFGEAMLLVVVAAPVVRFVPLRWIGTMAGRPLGRTRGDVVEIVQRVAWAVDAAARRSPLRALCFERGLAAQFMLRRRGIDSTLVYGVSPHRAGQKLAAHVWVRAGALDVVGAAEAADHIPVTSFPTNRVAG